MWKKANKINQSIFRRFLHYSETIFLWLTIFYFSSQVVSILLILYAIYQTNTFSYLDTFISETNNTFRSIAGIIIIKFLVENVFKYNDFGGLIPNKKVNNESENQDNDDIKICDLDDLCNEVNKSDDNSVG